jgi:hypothetical protein
MYLIEAENRKLFLQRTLKPLPAVAYTKVFRTFPRCTINWLFLNLEGLDYLIARAVDLRHLSKLHSGKITRV